MTGRLSAKVLVVSPLSVEVNVTPVERTSVYDEPERVSTSTVPVVVSRPPPSIGPCRTWSRVSVPVSGTTVAVGPATWVAAQLAVSHPRLGVPATLPRVIRAARPACGALACAANDTPTRPGKVATSTAAIVTLSMARTIAGKPARHRGSAAGLD
ncbi:hypothetical protein Noca_0262 [Nocardioides sp. JS614]|nr:hypothetical protein Noca_0262 [Nocardioides sp. JS614]